MGKFIDRTGLVYGRLIVIKCAGKIGRRIKWECLCKCGNKTLVSGSDLQTGNTLSCGCYKKQRISEGNTIHGLSGTPTHNIWMSLFSRCNNPKYDSYKYYGGRGIKVCERWNDFKNFLEDMGIRPSGATIDRIDSSKDYEPSNCRWVTNKQQQNNRSNNVVIEWKGERKTISEWSDMAGIKRGTLYFRIRNRWSIEHALTLPPANRIKYKTRIKNVS